MKARVHIIDTSEPLQSYNDLRMRCGKVVAFGNLEWAFGNELLADLADTLNGVCAKCQAATPTGEDKRDYVYGIRERQSMLAEAV